MGFTLTIYLVVQGQEGRYSVYIHASEKQSNQSFWKSSVFRGRDVQAEKVSEQLLFYTLFEVDHRVNLVSFVCAEFTNGVYMDHS